MQNDQDLACRVPESTGDAQRWSGTSPKTRGREAKPVHPPRSQRKPRQSRIEARETSLTPLLCPTTELPQRRPLPESLKRLVGGTDSLTTIFIRSTVSSPKTKPARLLKRLHFSKHSRNTTKHRPRQNLKPRGSPTHDAGLSQVSPTLPSLESQPGPQSKMVRASLVTQNPATGRSSQTLKKRSPTADTLHRPWDATTPTIMV